MSEFCDITFNHRDLNAALREFREDVAIKIVRASLRRIAKEEAAALQAVTPVGNPSTDRHSGRLRDNIMFGTALALTRGIVKSFVGVRTTGKTDNARNAFYWRWVEFGHQTRGASGTSSRGRKKAGRAFVEGKHFITGLISVAERYIGSQFFSDLQKGIDKTYLRGG